MKLGIFNYNTKRGLSTYERDLVSLLIYDDDFFKKSIHLIDQNTFQFESFRQIVGLMKDAWNNSGIHLQKDSIMMWADIKFKNNPMEVEEIQETLDMCNVVSESRAEEIKETFRYRNLFYYIAYATNHAYDSVFVDCCDSFGKLKAVAERFIEDAEKVKDALNTLEEVRENNGRNDW